MDKGPLVISKKPVVGISACCMGSPVRYNGKGWNMLDSIGREKNDFIWCPVCPEVFSGLGVPRDPIHIAGDNGGDVWRGTAKVSNRGRKDVTSEILEGCVTALSILEKSEARAYVYLDGSPSCGVYRTSLKNKRIGKPPGVFGSMLYDKGYFLIPVLDLQSPIRWWDWKRRLLAFLWLEDAAITNKKELYDVWYRYKFICQELDEPWAREKGRELAGLSNGVDEEYISFFKKEILDILRKPSKTNKIVNSLWKNYSYYRRVTHETIEGIYEPDIPRNVTKVAKELGVMERAAYDKGVFFGTSPVIYKGLSRR
ncbi:DUF523 domain-containing protein [Alkalibacter saccharofermentans]|uniref:Uncharacterized conserved protein YbbK, DUF523 family n=1 Tax=Alkalibacter saccharofermentans DSM 14828 TaxID=1120975 RepID=A0A1M4XWA8_9FIRM|nr:DUF523 domain-containing protein [Alkalibacter saccharofermentans]SHE97710.1 Uncharacterized conserved protein YbbK, DUF523 family [Alkalibacter saccharofermentans DSM 14828]